MCWAEELAAAPGLIPKDHLQQNVHSSHGAVEAAVRSVRVENVLKRGHVSIEKFLMGRQADRNDALHSNYERSSLFFFCTS